MVPAFYSLPAAVAISNTVIRWSGRVSTMTTDMNELKEKLGAAELKFDEVDTCGILKGARQISRKGGDT